MTDELKTLLERQVQDWSAQAGDLDPADAGEFTLRTLLDEVTGQVYLELGNGEHRLSLIVEVNKGRPCLHVHAGEDAALIVFADGHDLIVNTDGERVPEPASRLTYDSEDAFRMPATP
jgi:hypothetical protein